MPRYQSPSQSEGKSHSVRTRVRRLQSGGHLAISGRSRLSEKVFQRAVEAIDAHPDFLEQVFKASPTTFALIMVKLMPREHQITHQSRLSDMTDAQLEQALSYVRSNLAARAPSGTELGANPAESKDQLN